MLFSFMVICGLVWTWVGLIVAFTQDPGKIDRYAFNPVLGGMLFVAITMTVLYLIRRRFRIKRTRNVLRSFKATGKLP